MQVRSTITLLHSSTPKPSLSLLPFSKSQPFHYTLSPTLCRSRTPSFKLPPLTIRVHSSSSSENNNQTVTVDLTPTASEVVRSFYEGINGHDLASVEKLIADDCVYEDLIFPQPFVGRQAIMDFFKKFIDTISRDLQFVIDDISSEDSSCVGVTWHLEWKGKTFPFSKGCSVYRLTVVNGRKQIVYGRDSVEPAIKPGESALAIIRAVTWLLQKFPQLADQL